MQLKQIPRDALLKPLQAVSGIVERRQTLPILANVLVEQKDGRLFMTATDLEMQITAHSDLAGKQDQSVTVAARKLQDLLRALPDDATLNIDNTNNQVSGSLQINLYSDEGMGGTYRIQTDSNLEGLVLVVFEPAS